MAVIYSSDFTSQLRALIAVQHEEVATVLEINGTVVLRLPDIIIQADRERLHLTFFSLEDALHCLQGNLLNSISDTLGHRFMVYPAVMHEGTLRPLSSFGIDGRSPCAAHSHGLG